MAETAPARDTNLGRRHFLIGGAVVAGALYVGFRVADKRPQAAAGDADATFKPNAFVRIAADDTVTVIIGKSEMGQGIYTSLPMVLAEELDVLPARVRVEFAPVDKAFFMPFFPAQLTGGSSSMNSLYPSLRKAGATARAMLLEAAAQRLKTSVSSLQTTGDGAVSDGHTSLRYGELVALAAKVAVPGEVALKDPKTFRYIGKGVRRLDSPGKVSGRTEFGLDVRRPEMLFAMVARSPVFGGKVTAFDDTAARAIPGVVDVKQVPSGVAVLGKNTYAARRGRDALQVKWDLGAGAPFSTEAIAED